jgi:hypothetical protein
VGLFQQIHRKAHDKAVFIAGGPARTRALSLGDARALLTPTALFWALGLLIYGSIAVHAAGGHFLDQTARDIWPHLAVLKTLITDPVNPVNPFIPTQDTSRQFHPYWVGIALVARLLSWNEWQAFAFAGFFSAGVLLSGIYTFGLAFYRDTRGPLALLVAMVFGWMYPIAHTGYHSPSALLEGIAYPATLLIGLSLIFGALVIRTLERPGLALLLAPLASLMFAIHQLGAGMAFVLAGWLALLWPESRARNRAVALGSMGVGLLASTLWPYFNPIEAVIRTGNVTWTGDFDFYGPILLGSAFVPSVLGLLGLFSRDFGHRSRPIVAALVTYVGIFMLGRFGIAIATRFLMPAVLMLHIGLGALLIVLSRRWSNYSSGRQLAVFGIGMAILSAFVITSSLSFQFQSEGAHQDGNNYVSALALTRDIPDMQPVAVYDVAVWPIVATGQRALSEPWPEPGISQLAERQAVTERLFDPALDRQQRVALAKNWGVKVLIMHSRGALRKEMPARLVETLAEQSVRQERSGPFLRFDLY